MTKKTLREELKNKDKIKWKTVKRHLSVGEVQNLKGQFKGVTMITDDDGDTAVPSRDVEKALDNPGEVV